MNPYQQLLDLIAWSEGTSTHSLTKDRGYDVLVTGIDGPQVFTDYSTHPYETRPSTIVRMQPRLRSTAAGRYQIMLRTWQSYKATLGLKDFSPASQDAIAIKLIKERLAGTGIVVRPAQPQATLNEIVARCSNIWASLPGNSYGQGGRSLDALWTEYTRLGSSPDVLV